MPMPINDLDIMVTQSTLDESSSLDIVTDSSIDGISADKGERWIRSFNVLWHENLPALLLHLTSAS